MSFNFGEVLSRALQITWKHKILWLGGIVYALFAFIMGFLPNYLFNPFFTGNMEAMTNMEQEPWYIFLFFGSAFLLMLISIPVGVVVLTLPVVGTLQSEKEEIPLKLGDLFRESLRYFWRILGIFGLVGIGVLVVMIIFFGCIALASVATMGIGIVLVFPLYCVLLILMIIVYAYAVLSQISVVADNSSIFVAMQRGWEVVKDNFWVIVLLCLIIYFGFWLLSVLISIPFMIPMYMNMFKMMESMDNLGAFQTDLMKTMSLWMLIYAPIYAVFQGVAFTFMQSAWSLTYLRLTRKSELSEAPVFAEPNA